MPFSTEVLADSPACYWQHRASGGATTEVDASGNGNTLNYTLTGLTQQQASITGEASDYSILFDDANQGGGTLITPAAVAAATSLTLEWVGTIDDAALTSRALIWLQPDAAGPGASNSGVAIYLESDGTLTGSVTQNNGTAVTLSGTTDIRDNAPHHVVLTCDGSFARLYVDGTEQTFAACLPAKVSNGGTDVTGIGCAYLTFSPPTLAYYTSGLVCESAIYTAALSSTRIEAHAAQLGFAPGSGLSVLGMSLSSRLTSPAVSLGMQLNTQTSSGSSSLGMSLHTPDPTHYEATIANWDVGIILDGSDVSGLVTGSVTIEHEEDASGIASFRLYPVAGSIDPDDYERKPVQINFVGLNSSGVPVYTVRRFTGITSNAAYDPSAGVVLVDATTDLQGQFENISRETAEAIIGGRWSEHVFNDDADGWRYALDRLSTVPKELHVNNYGGLSVVSWAAKATPDFTLTDGDIVDGRPLTITRAKRRDLITRVRIAMDFRFVRLRHREMSVQFATPGFCSWANQGWTLPSKDMIRSGADGSQWTRISDITFQDLPVPGTYCTPSRGWVGGADAFCLGANWVAARRWAQTITEEYTLDVIAPDLEESVGVQLSESAYGIEATYDATDFEAIKEFDDSPGGSVLSTKTDDWQKDATDAEADGRTAMEAAQECAIDRARMQILSRARKNRVQVYPLYNPAITLEHTVRVNTTWLDAKGKVARLYEQLNTQSGEVSMSLWLAISRHGGSGLAADDPVAPAPTPEQDQETSTGRSYGVPFRLGGIVNAPQDDQDWDGYMTNVRESERDPSGGIYRERFVVKMPTIEATARNATAVQQLTEYEVAVPEDSLTMSK